MYTNIEFLNNKLYCMLIQKDGSIVKKIIDKFRPKLYTRYDPNNPNSRKTNWKVLKTNEPLMEHEIELRDYESKLQDIIQYTNVYNNIEPNYQFISDQYYGITRERINIRHFFIDIETMINHRKPDPINTPNEVSLIQINDSIDNKNYIFSIKESKKERPNTIIYICKDEKDLLNKFIDFIEKMNPITVNAWFGYGFDYPYLINRMKMLGINYLRLSPYQKMKKKKVNIFGKSEVIEVPVGRYFLDYKEIYEKFSYGSRESYSLEFISQYELGEGKVQFKHIAADLDEIYNDQYELFLDYGIQDVQLLHDLDKKLSYLNIMMNQAWDMGCNFDDVFGTVKPWTLKIYNVLKKDCIALPDISNNLKQNFEGAYINLFSPGKKEYIINYDVTSLYPNVIRANNISYECIVDDEDYDNWMLELKNDLLKKGQELYIMNLQFSKSGKERLKDIILGLRKRNMNLAPSGEFFRKDIDGVLPKVIKDIFDSRKRSQKKALQYSKLSEIVKTIQYER